MEDVYDSVPENFQMDKALTVREGTDVTLIACGELVRSALDAALLLEEKDCTARSMYDAVKQLLDDPKRLAAMHEAALGLAIFDSAQRIYDNIMTLIR